MSPRKYDMGKRAAATAETRRRIVDATRALHAEQGIGATSWDAIAARAGVGVGTVYRHFPSLDELIPACGAVTMEVLAPPEPAVVAGAGGGAERLRRLVEEVFALYERGSRELWAIRREAGVHPHLERDRDRVEAALGALVDAALEPLRPSPADRALTRALVDLGTWEALRTQGLGQAEAVEAIQLLLGSRLLRP